MKIHNTLAPDKYYTDFNELPESAQDKLMDIENLVIDCSRYTVFENIAFLRADIEIDGRSFQAEIHLGSLESQDDLDENGDIIEGTEDCYGDRANDLYECFEPYLCDVYLTEY